MRLQPIPLGPLDDAPGVEMALLSSADSPQRVTVHTAVLQPGASLPRHPAGRAQVFYVVTGRGRVAGDDDVAMEITAGWAATWAPGEPHTSWAETEMTVLIIQGAPIEP